MKMKERIWKWLEDHGSITTWEAFTELGCTRLSEYIRQLRTEHEISERWVATKNRYDENVKYKVYIYESV